MGDRSPSAFGQAVAKADRSLSGEPRKRVDDRLWWLAAVPSSVERVPFVVGVE